MTQTNETQSAWMRYTQPIPRGVALTRFLDRGDMLFYHNPDRGISVAIWRCEEGTAPTQHYHLFITDVFLGDGGVYVTHRTALDILAVLPLNYKEFRLCHPGDYHVSMELSTLFGGDREAAPWGDTFPTSPRKEEAED